jgi:hypothetical protein
MTENWRLVGKELFNIREDPGQKVDLAMDHPDIVKRLMEKYEAWWEDIDDKFNEYNRTVIGSGKQPETKLDCQFWHGPQALYNQQHVRAGLPGNGFWDLRTDQEGTYRITLRRWPKELDIAIDDTFPAPVLDPTRHYTGDAFLKYHSGKLVPVKARLQVGEFDETQPVLPGQKDVVFLVNLPKGELDLQTWFTDEGGKEWGAYYVYIKRQP